MGNGLPIRPKEYIDLAVLLMARFDGSGKSQIMPRRSNFQTFPHFSDMFFTPPYFENSFNIELTLLDALQYQSNKPFSDFQVFTFVFCIPISFSTDDLGSHWRNDVTLFSVPDYSEFGYTTINYFIGCLNPMCTKSFKARLAVNRTQKQKPYLTVYYATRFKVTDKDLFLPREYCEINQRSFYSRNSNN